MTSFRIDVLLIAALCLGVARADTLPDVAPDTTSMTSDGPSAQDVPDAPDAPDTTGPISSPGPVAVGDINVVDGDAVGVLDEAASGLSRDMWVNAPRDQLETLLTAIPITSGDSTVRSLARRLLLTASDSPVGSGKRALISIRIEKLLDAGMVEDAAALAVQARLPGDADFARVQAEAILLAGDVEHACSETTAQRLINGDVFWLELRAYCFALAGDQGQVDLIDQLLEAQGKTDDVYRMLRNDVVQHLNYMPGLIAEPTSLHVFLLKAAHLSVPMEVTVRLHLNAPRPVPVVPSGPVVMPEDMDAAASAFGSGDQVQQRRAALVIGVADSLDIPMPDKTRALLPQLNTIAWTGARPSLAEMAKIDEAASQPGRRGEALLRLIETLDARDLSGMAPDATAYFVRTLRGLGFEPEARAIAARALREYRDIPPAAPVQP